DYRYLTLQNSPVRKGQEQIYRTLDKYAETFKRQFEDDGERIKSLYLWSANPGTGKTSSAAALLNAWLVEHYLGSLKRNRQALQQPAYFLDVNELQTKYNLATMTSDEKELDEVKRTMRRCMDVPFLVMDDCGIRSASESFKSIVHAIINARTTGNKPTVFTSNLPIEDMAKVFDARLYDRIR
ncbi:DNA replication protein, partial [Klebsiella pneumoniae]